MPLHYTCWTVHLWKPFSVSSPSPRHHHPALTLCVHVIPLYSTCQAAQPWGPLLCTLYLLDSPSLEAFFRFFPFPPPPSSSPDSLCTCDASIHYNTCWTIHLWKPFSVSSLSPHRCPPARTLCVTPPDPPHPLSYPPHSQPPHLTNRK